MSRNINTTKRRQTNYSFYGTNKKWNPDNFELSNIAEDGKSKNKTRLILNIMWYSIVRLKVKWNQWFFFLHNALPIWEENGGLDYQLFFKAVRTFLIERSSTKIAQNSYSPFTKMTFACSESNFFQYPPSQIHIKR